MVKDQFSYWITIRPDRTMPAPGPATDLMKTLAEALAETGILDGNSLLRVDPDSTDDCLSIEVDPSVGTIEEDIGIRLALDGFAPQWPGYDFELTELDEDDKSVQVHSRWHAGKLVRRSRARLVRADEDYDRQTADKLLGFLFGASMPADMRDRLRENFAAHLANEEGGNANA